MGVVNHPELPEGVDPADYLRLVAGDLCPCGHDVSAHNDASGEIEGEVYGACNDCDCNGAIDLSDDF